MYILKDIDGRSYTVCRGDSSQSDSPCDLCERSFCPSVEECEEEYGSDSYFKLLVDNP